MKISNDIKPTVKHKKTLPELQQSFSNLSNIVTEDYGVSITNASTTVISWALTALEKQIGKDAARAELSALNEYSARVGSPLHYI